MLMHKLHINKYVTQKAECGQQENEESDKKL